MTPLVRCILSLALLAVSVVGCGTHSAQPPVPGPQGASAATAERSQPATPVPEPETRAKTSAPAHPAPTASTTAGMQPGQIKLVPLPDKYQVGFKLDYPDGWPVQVSAQRDVVQIRKDPVTISVMTRQLRGEKVPITAEEMKKAVAGWAPSAMVKERRIPGIISAFELRYTYEKDGREHTTLEILVFGKTYKESLAFSLPSSALADWLPLFQEIIASYRPSNLNADPLPGRP